MRSTVAEYCPNCEEEIEMIWDVERSGYQARCPVCGNLLMLCDECRHRENGRGMGCDWNSKTSTCRYHKSDAERKDISPRYEICKDCGKTWNVSLSYRMPVGGYLCPKCAAKYRLPHQNGSHEKSASTVEIVSFCNGRERRP